MGGRGGPLWRRITYKLPSPARSEDQNAPPPKSALKGHVGSGSSSQHGILVEVDSNGVLVVSQPISFFNYLEDLVQGCRLAVSAEDASGLPFNFWGGLVGCLGYELKAECGGRNAHASPTPDAAFFLSDRTLAMDLLTGDVYLLAMHRIGDEGRATGIPRIEDTLQAEEWIRDTAILLERLAAADSPRMEWNDLHLCRHNVSLESGRCAPDPSIASPCDSCRAASVRVFISVDPCSGLSDPDASKAAPLTSPAPPPFRLRHGRSQYMANIEAYRQALHDGESYEVRRIKDYVSRALQNFVTSLILTVLYYPGLCNNSS